MRKINLKTFIHHFKDEIVDFEENQGFVNPEQERTLEEWVSYFLLFSGYQKDNEEEYLSDEYIDDIDYYEDFEHEEYISRRKYRSFRDDERY